MLFSLSLLGIAYIYAHLQLLQFTTRKLSGKRYLTWVAHTEEKVPPVITLVNIQWKLH